MSFKEVVEPLERWTREGEPAGVATLLEVRRSAPRPPGARFAVSGSGEVAGSVSSGCVEGDLHARLQGVLFGEPPAVVDYGITDEMAADVGLACGGEIRVLLAPHDPYDEAWTALADAVERTEPAVLVTGLSEAIRARRLLLRPGRPQAGTLGDPALDAAAGAAAAELFEAGGTRLLEVLPSPGTPAEDRLASAATTAARNADGAAWPEAVTLFAEAFLPPPRLAIVGASPVARALCHLAYWAGWEVHLVDPRTTFADPARFPEAAAVHHRWPEEGLAEVGLGPYLDVVVLAHDRKLDVPALAAALRAGCLYVGQIGGRRTQRLRREALEELGFEGADLERIRGPVGLDIGAVSPEEIAVSIVAQLIALGRGPGRQAV